MKLYLIRHGQTDWNIERRIQGQQDIPLNETGRAQAACLTKAMKDKKLTAIYTSPQIRPMPRLRQQQERILFLSSLCRADGD